MKMARSYSPNPIDENTSYTGFVFGAIREGYGFHNKWFYNDDKWRYDFILSLQILRPPQSDIILLEKIAGLGGFNDLCSELPYSEMVDVSSVSRSKLVTH